MGELKSRITENGIDYILVGDYYIPDLKLPEEHRPIGKYGRLHREYLREAHPARLNTLTLTGELWTYLADLNEQAQERLASCTAASFFPSPYRAAAKSITSPSAPQPKQW
jgi:hypothetical protein